MSITAQAPAGLVLLSNASATGSPVLWPGGKGTFLVQATGTGSVTLEVMGPDGTNYVTVGTDTTITTTEGGGNFELPRCYIRAAVDTFTAVYATATRLPD